LPIQAFALPDRASRLAFRCIRQVGGDAEQRELGSPATIDSIKAGKYRRFHALRRHAGVRGLSLA